MVKIEKLSSDCIARIEGNMVAVGQLYTLIEFRNMFVQSGSVTVSIDEKEIVTVDAIPAPAPIVDPIADTAVDLMAELENMNKVLEPKAVAVEPEAKAGAKDLGSLLAPVAKITVPKAKITKPA